MAWLPMYVEPEDVQILLEYLNGSSKVGFIVRTTPKRLAVVSEIEAMPDGRYQLWHVDGEALPLFRERWTIFGKRQFEEKVADPFHGWEETRVGANGEPWFGGSFPDMYSLEIRTHSRKRPDEIGMSCFEWAGNYYWALGQRASPCVKLWWEDLRKWAGKAAKRIPRTGAVVGPNKEIYAFPAAFRAISEGKARADNPGV